MHSNVVCERTDRQRDRQTDRQANMLITILHTLFRGEVTRKLSSIDDRGHTDRITALPRPHALNSAAAMASVAPGRTPHVTIKAYYYGSQ